MGNNYNDSRGTTKTSYKVGKLDIDASLVTSQSEMVYDTSDVNGSVLVKNGTTFGFISPIPNQGTGTLNTTAPISLQTKQNTSVLNRGTITLDINAPTTQAGNNIIFNYATSLPNQTITITPNDGTNNLDFDNYTVGSFSTPNLKSKKIVYDTTRSIFWVLCNNPDDTFDYLVTISESTGAILNTYLLSSVVGNNIVYDSTQDVIWFSETSPSNNIRRIDASTGSITNTISVTGAINDIDYDPTNNLLWVGQNDLKLTKINASTNSIVASYSADAVKIQYDSTNNYVWVAGSSALRRFNVATSSFLSGSFSINVSEFVYIASYNEIWAIFSSVSSVAVFNGTTGALIQYVSPSPFGGNSDIKYDSVNDTLWVSTIYNPFSVIRSTRTYQKMLTLYPTYTAPWPNRMMVALGSAGTPWFTVESSGVVKAKTNGIPVIPTTAQVAEILTNGYPSDLSATVYEYGTSYLNGYGGDATPVANGGEGDGATAYITGGSEGVITIPDQTALDGCIQYKQGLSFSSSSSLFWDYVNGRLGIGTSTPAQVISAAGVIESTVGGFKFPDSSVQTTAAVPTPSYVYRSFSNNTLGNTAGSDLAAPILIIETGTLITGKIGLENTAMVNLDFDIRKNGISILTSFATILSGSQFSSVFSFSDTSLATNDLLTIELVNGTCDGFDAVLKIQL